MTDYKGAVETGDGLVGASFREVPGNARDRVLAIARGMEEAGLGVVIDVGWPGRPLFDIPVSMGRLGVVVMGGLNPVAILEETGMRVRQTGRSPASSLPQSHSLRPAGGPRRSAVARRLSRRRARPAAPQPGDPVGGKVLEGSGRDAAHRAPWAGSYIATDVALVLHLFSSGGGSRGFGLSLYSIRETGAFRGMAGPRRDGCRWSMIAASGPGRPMPTSGLRERRDALSYAGRLRQEHADRDLLFSGSWSSSRRPVARS
jgi:hypothetical protein